MFPEPGFAPTRHRADPAIWRMCSGLLLQQPPTSRIPSLKKCGVDSEVLDRHIEVPLTHTLRVTGIRRQLQEALHPRFSRRLHDPLGDAV